MGSKKRVCVVLLIFLITAGIVLMSVGIVPYAQGNATLAPTPNKVRLPETWTVGDKLGMGTAYTYDSPGEGNPSTIWFSITGGAITDVTYPTIDQANVKTLALIVTDGKTFATRDDDPVLTSVAIERLDGRSPAYQI